MSWPCLVASFRSCVLSRFFLLHLLWLSIMQLRHYLFIGTLNPMLNRLADNDPDLGNKASSPQFSLLIDLPDSADHHHPTQTSSFFFFLTISVSQYTNAFAMTQLCGVLCAPWNGLIMDRHKGKPLNPGKSTAAVACTC